MTIIKLNLGLDEEAYDYEDALAEYSDDYHYGGHPDKLKVWLKQNTKGTFKTFFDSIEFDDDADAVFFQLKIGNDVLLDQSVFLDD